MHHDHHPAATNAFCISKSSTEQVMVVMLAVHAPLTTSKGKAYQPAVAAEEDEEVLGILGLLLTTVTSAPLGMLGSPLLSMGMVTLPGELLVTTTTWPSLFWKVACAPAPVRMAAVGVPLLPVTNWTG